MLRRARFPVPPSALEPDDDEEEDDVPDKKAAPPKKPRKPTPVQVMNSSIKGIKTY